MDEQGEAAQMANHLLNDIYADPDDGLRMLSRQLLRMHEELCNLQATNKALVDALTALHHNCAACHLGSPCAVGVLIGKAAKR